MYGDNHHFDLESIYVASTVVVAEVEQERNATAAPEIELLEAVPPAVQTNNLPHPEQGQPVPPIRGVPAVLVQPGRAVVNQGEEQRFAPPARAPAEGALAAIVIAPPLTVATMHVHGTDRSSSSRTHSPDQISDKSDSPQVSSSSVNSPSPVPLAVAGRQFWQRSAILSSPGRPPLLSLDGVRSASTTVSQSSRRLLGAGSPRRSAYGVSQLLADISPPKVTGTCTNSLPNTPRGRSSIGEEGNFPGMVVSSPSGSSGINTPTNMVNSPELSLPLPADFMDNYQTLTPMRSSVGGAPKAVVRPLLGRSEGSSSRVVSPAIQPSLPVPEPADTPYRLSVSERLMEKERPPADDDRHVYCPITDQDCWAIRVQREVYSATSAIAITPDQVVYDQRLGAMVFTRHDFWDFANGGLPLGMMAEFIRRGILEGLTTPGAVACTIEREPNVDRRILPIYRILFNGDRPLPYTHIVKQLLNRLRRLLDEAMVNEQHEGAGWQDQLNRVLAVAYQISATLQILDRIAANFQLDNLDIVPSWTGLVVRTVGLSWLSDGAVEGKIDFWQLYEQVGEGEWDGRPETIGTERLDAVMRYLRCVEERILSRFPDGTRSHSLGVKGLTRVHPTHERSPHDYLIARLYTLFNELVRGLQTLRERSHLYQERHGNSGRMLEVAVPVSGRRGVTPDHTVSVRVAEIPGRAQSEGIEAVAPRNTVDNHPWAHPLQDIHGLINVLEAIYERLLELLATE